MPVSVRPCTTGEELQRSLDIYNAVYPRDAVTPEEAENFKFENQKTAATPIPFHPGAVKYFAEKGVKLN